MYPIKDTIAGFKEILEGKHDSKSEQAFYMKGDISEVKDKSDIKKEESEEEKPKEKAKKKNDSFPASFL
jgi:hypothetical protein